jgi:hypothetical protein
MGKCNEVNAHIGTKIKKQGRNKMEPITNDMDIIDSRDIIKRVAEIDDNLAEDDYSEIDEFDALSSIIDQISDYGVFKYGESLIREDYFTEYCRESCEDTGDVPHNLPWYIENHLDWEGVAKELQQDYVEVDFDGVSYFTRG